MRSRPGPLWQTGSVLVAVLAVLAFLPSQAGAQFQLGLQDPGFQAAPGTRAAQLADTALHRIDGSVIRIAVYWSSVAPNTPTAPAGFDPSNPADPHYNWAPVDAGVRIASQLHARVILNLLQAPQWAEGPNRPPYTNPLTIYPGAWDPSPTAFSQFAHAAAVRYGGSYPDPLHPGEFLPRVSDWEIWNEENLPIYLAAPNLVDEYRALLDAGYGAIKAVNASNVIVLGGLAPVSFLPPLSIPPLQFAAELLCLHRVGTRFFPNQSCPEPAEFNVFAIHPYSLAATPTKHAYAYDNVLVGDMGKVHALVSAADRFHTATISQIWVSEWGWFTNPPDALVGDSGPVAARYVAYSLYEMWRSGVDLVVWQNVQDRPTADRLGGGLYTQSGRPKPMLTAFAFPFVASVAGRSGFAWGRVPISGRRWVRVQRLSGHRWRTVATVLSGPAGIFQAHFRAHGNGLYRATVTGGPTSLSYNSRPIPPRRTHLFNSG